MLGRRRHADRLKRPAFGAVQRRSVDRPQSAAGCRSFPAVQQPLLANSIVGAVIVGDAAWLGEV